MEESKREEPYANFSRERAMASSLVESKGSCYFLAGMSLLGAVLFCGGMVDFIRHDVEIDIDDYYVLLLLGYGAFVLFFPLFMSYYFSHYLFRSLEQIEKRLDRLEGMTDDSAITNTPDDLSGEEAQDACD